MSAMTQPSQSTGAQEAEARRLIRASKYAVGLGLVPLLAWLVFAPLASAVIAPAVVKVEFNRSPVQHAEGGTVREVRVHNGQHVVSGQPLIILGDVAVDADMQRLDTRVRAEQASIARLESEQEMLSAMRVPADLTEAAHADPGLAELLQKEKALFDARRSALVDQTALLRAQRVKVAQEVEAMRGQIDRARESLKLQQAELATNQRLVKDGYVSTTRVTQLEASVADYGVKLEERKAELAQAEQRIIDTELKIKNLESAYRQQASDQLKETLARLGEIQQEQRKAGDAASRQAITAPVDGVVMNLRVTNPGTVIASRETVAEIVPSDQRLVFEARLRPEDIDRVQEGQAAEVRFGALGHRSTARIDGKVSYVAADRLVDTQSGIPYVVMQVEADPASLKAATDARMMAGMPAEVFVEGPSRTALEYLVEPIRVAASHAGRER